MDFLHHPAFQSVVAPALLTLLCCAALGAAPSSLRAWAPLGAAAGLVLALLWWPGLGWPATSAAQKLPWLAVAATVAMALHAIANRALHGMAVLVPWLAMVLIWLGSLWWLGGLALSQPVTLGLAVLGGAAVLGLSALAADRSTPLPHHAGASAAAALSVATLGLAALAAVGGSLLLAQLAAMVAVATAVLGLWTWWLPHSAVRATPSALLPLALAASTVAWLQADAARAGAIALALLLLALTTPWWLVLAPRSRPGAQPWRWAPLVVALMACVPVAAAVGWTLWADAQTAGEQSSDDDDPYYKPDWD